MLFEKVINKKYKVLKEADSGAGSVNGADVSQKGQESPTGASGVENAKDNAYMNRAGDAEEQDAVSNQFELYKTNLKNSLVKFVNLLIKEDVLTDSPEFDQLFSDLSVALSKDPDAAFDSFKKIVDVVSAKQASKTETNPVDSLKDSQQL